MCQRVTAVVLCVCVCACVCVCVCVFVCVSAPANLRTGATTRLTEGIGVMSGTFVTIIKSSFF